MTFINPGVICEITRPKLSGIGEHAGVLLPNGQVVHHGQGGPRVDTLNAFAQGLPVKVIRTTDRRQQWEILQRIQSRLRHPPAYRLLDSNCEHFVSDVLGTQKESRQINGLAVIGLLFAGIAAFG